MAHSHAATLLAGLCANQGFSTYSGDKAQVPSFYASQCLLVSPAVTVRVDDVGAAAAAAASAAVARAVVLALADVAALVVLAIEVPAFFVRVAAAVLHSCSSSPCCPSLLFFLASFVFPSTARALDSAQSQKLEPTLAKTQTGSFLHAIA